MKYYFLGIGGTAMASLAVLLKQKGHDVWGADQNLYPPMSDLLSENQIKVYEGYTPEHLNEYFDQVIIGNALSRGNKEVEEILNRRLPFTSMPQLIYQVFLKQQKSIVITGTHGKTTTTGLMSWILEAAALAPSFLVGGILKNFGYSSRFGKGDYFVIEGDEYDTAFFDKRPKFLHYFPHILIINNIEFDHSDIYDNIDQIKNEFKKLVRIIPENGLKKFYEFTIPMIGEYQIYNSLAVIAAATFIGLEPADIQKGLDSFQGVKRRLEYWGQINGAYFYDDFAHHPTAITETLKALRKKHPEKAIVAIFEPRTNTTIKNIFQTELAEALSHAEIIILTPVHRADKIPVEKRLSLKKLAADLKKMGRTVYPEENYQEISPRIKKVLDASKVAVLMTNGDLGGQYQILKNNIQKSSTT
ncbi:MAG: Mur ligase family protein [Calditrichia bacterium]